MLTAPVIRADELETTAETPHLELLPSPVAVAEPAKAFPISPASSPAVPADLYADMVAGAPNLVVVDARYPEAYAREHLPGAVNLPFRELDLTTTAQLSPDPLYVVYCWNASCHASTRIARRLEALGFQVKELHGGLETWRKQGYPTERG
jgi:rhodanese-related sulfurtransferase